MILNDILGALYAPHKAFKRIIQNPKYLGVAIILLIFIGVQTGYYFSYYSKINYEQTSPSVDQLNAWASTNATLWTTNGASVFSNYVDFINETYLGNNSLQFSISDSGSLTLVLNDFNSPVKCGDGVFNNITMRIKLVDPQVAPQIVSLDLFSGSTSNYFQYDLTNQFSASSIGQWSNLTLPVGSGNWVSSGSANWTNITGLKLAFTYPSGSNITVRIQGLFFRGEYLTVLQGSGDVAFAASAVESTLIQFLFQWIILTAVVYLLLKGLKAANITWKPLFIAIGFVLIVLVITSLIDLVATLTLPTVYYPYEFPPYPSTIYPESIIATASAQSQATYNAIVAAASTFNAISTTMTLVLYTWQAALVTLIVRELTGFSYAKSIAVAIASVLLAILIFGVLASIGLV